MTLSPEDAEQLKQWIAQRHATTGETRLESLHYIIREQERWIPRDWRLPILHQICWEAYVAEERPKHPDMTDEEFECWLQLNT